MANSSGDHRNMIVEAAKLIRDAANYRYNLDTLFRDFVNLAVLAIRNKVEPKGAAWDAREAEYLKIINGYDKTIVPVFPELLARLILMAENGFSDHLGSLYMALEIANKAHAQYFTPYQVSHLMASLALSKAEIEAKIAENGLITLHEPASGAGGMVVAMAHVLHNMGYEPSRHMRVDAQDIDRTCCLMTYLNCYLHQIPCQVIWGNSIIGEVREVLLTPALIAQCLQTKASRDAAA